MSECPKECFTLIQKGVEITEQNPNSPEFLKVAEQIKQMGCGPKCSSLSKATVLKSLKQKKERQIL